MNDKNNNKLQNNIEPKNEINELPGKTKKEPRKPALYLRIILGFFNGLFWFLGGLFTLLLVLGWINSSGVIPPSWPIYGFDYLPPYMLGFLIIPVFLIGMFTKKKALSAALLLLFLAYWSLNGDHNLFRKVEKPEYAEGVKTVSVMTINVAQFFPGMEWMGREIEKIRPDIICFQEHENFGAWEYEKLKHAFPSYNIAVGKHTDSGIMSVYPILSLKEIELSSIQPVYHDNTPEKLKDQPNRRFLHAVIDKGSTKIHVLNLRLIAGRSKQFNEAPFDVIRWGKFLIETQAREVVEMADYIETLEGPVIYAGDLNAPPNAAVMKPLYEKGTDVFKATEKFPPKTFPAVDPNQRLDYIFCTGGLEPVYGKVINAQFSDHLPTVAQLKMPW